MDGRFEDNSFAFLTALRGAQANGLLGAARAYQRDMKRELRGGEKGFVFRTTIGNVGRLVSKTSRLKILPEYYGKQRSFSIKSKERRPWYTGLLWNSVTIGTIESTPAGDSVRVGTNVKYALYWELGHQNIYTKHFERDAKWVPTFEKNRQTYALAFSSAFKRQMQHFVEQRAAGDVHADNGQDGYIGQGGEGAFD